MTAGSTHRSASRSPLYMLNPWPLSDHTAGSCRRLGRPESPSSGVRASPQRRVRLQAHSDPTIGFSLLVPVNGDLHGAGVNIPDEALNGTRFEQRGSTRSEEHTSELQSLMRISYAVFCLNKKKNTER